MTGDGFLGLPSLSRTDPIRCWSSCRRITSLLRLRQKLLGLRLDAQSSIGQRSTALHAGRAALGAAAALVFLWALY